jgi:NAD dependent epimerase/dehydratase family enzyme
MAFKNQNQFENCCYKNMNELLNSECTPLIDVLFKLSSIANNFASAAHNTKNISIEDRHEIDELLDLVFETRKLADKVEKLVEENIDNSIALIKSGVFERIMLEKAKKEIIEEASEVSEAIKKTIDKKAPK